MTAMIIPLRADRDATSALASFDAAAAELLADGRATTLSRAQLDAILASLCKQRGKLSSVITDLAQRGSSGIAQIDTLNADLSDEAGKGLAQINLLIGYVATCAATAERSDVVRCACFC